MNFKYLFSPVLCCLLFAACNNTKSIQSKQAYNIAVPDFSDADKLPAPYATLAVRNNSKVIGWPASVSFT
ncbi:hypothetical protein [Ferruginibacter sp.]|nr:hypothetical protein [Ferruginibacter sp.]